MVNVAGAADAASPSTTAALVANLPSTGAPGSTSTVLGPNAVPTATALPSTNSTPPPAVQYTAETTVVAYDVSSAARTR